MVAAFDIDRRKVGLDVSKAIFSPPNCTKVFCDKVKLTGAIVKMGCVLDSYAPHMARPRSAPHVSARSKKNPPASKSSPS